MDIRDKHRDIERRIAALEGEIERLEAEREEIEEFIRLADKFGVRDLTTQSVANVTAELVNRLANQPKKTLRDQILDTAEQVLSDGERRVSRDLLPKLKELGVELGGKDPVLNLSSYLSKAKDRFTSDVRAGGWTLTRLTKKRERPDDAGTSSGLISNVVSH